MAILKEIGLKFHSFDVLKIVFERSDLSVDYKVNINIENAIHSPKGDLSNFRVYFHLNISNDDVEKPLNIQIMSVGHFELIGELEDPVIENYKKISAPSIIYPYLRAFLSNLTLQAGIKPILLPAMNFANIQILEKESINKATETD